MNQLQKNSQPPLLQKSIKEVIADFTSSFNSVKGSGDNNNLFFITLYQFLKTKVFSIPLTTWLQNFLDLF